MNQIYTYDNFSKENGDLLYVIGFESIKDYNEFKRKSGLGYNIIADSKTIKVSIKLNDTEMGIDILDRFLTSVNLNASEWFKIQKSKNILIPHKARNNSTKIINYNYNVIENVSQEEYTYLDKFPINLLICAMDLECTSNDHTFPDPLITNDYIIKLI